MRITIMFSCLLAVGMLVSVPVQAEGQVQAGATAATPHPEGGARPVPFGPRVEVLWERDGDRASECEAIGGFGSGYEFPNRFRGNALAMTEDRELTEFKLELEFSGERDLYFSIHRADPGSNLYTRLEGWTDILVTETGVGRTYYESGELVPPVTLESGYRYALGVAWWQPATKYGLDSESYPQDFEGGEVLGGVALTLGDAPPIPATVSLPPYSGGAYSMMICFEERPGACCINDNGQYRCDDTLTEHECDELAGTGVSVEFTAPGILCETGMCPLADGACCVSDPDACYTSLNEYSCQAYPGVWHEGESCPDACLPTGACCVGEQCFDDQIETDCGDLGGVYHGDNSTCSEVSCYKGACCDGLICSEVHPEQCVAPALFAGPGTRCDQDPCTPRGACCLDVEVCGDQYTAAECAAAGGYYRGDATSCDTLEVGCLLGACCTVTSGCRPNPLPQSVCQNIGGTWRGEGSSCATIDPQCSGLCCEGEVCYDGQTPDDCDFLSGDFIGYGTCPEDPEDPNPCEDLPDTKACCLPDGSCEVLPQAVCASFGGIYKESSSTCDPSPCDPLPEQGACCLAGGGCAITTEDACDTAGGAFYQEGSTCEVGLCTLGACCRGPDDCEDDPAAGGVEFKCQDGTFLVGVVCGDYSPCDEVPCCVGEACIDTSSLVCYIESGMQLPGLGACEEDSCAVGACCYEPGECGVMIGYDCTLELDSTFFEEFDVCDPDPCDVVACCKDDLCEEVSTAQCLADGGMPLDTDTCEAGACVAGACCYDGGTCGEMVQYECDVLAGTLLAGLTCDPNPCQVPSLISSVPEDGLIDARQPHELLDLTPQGFSVIQVCFDMPVFDVGAAALDVDDFTVVETPEQAAPVPVLTAVVDLGGNCYEVQLERPITPGVWTTIIADVYGESGTAIDPAADRIDVGFLPGDVDSSRLSVAVDITVLVDTLNGVFILPATSTDIDRSETANANDIVQLIDLLRGGEMFEEWYYAQLPPQP